MRAGVGWCATAVRINRQQGAGGGGGAWGRAKCAQAGNASPNPEGVNNVFTRGKRRQTRGMGQVQTAVRGMCRSCVCRERGTKNRTAVTVNQELKGRNSKTGQHRPTTVYGERTSNRHQVGHTEPTRARMVQISKNKKAAVWVTMKKRNVVQNPGRMGG